MMAIGAHSLVIKTASVMFLKKKYFDFGATVMMISEGVVESTEGLDRLPTPVPVANPRIRPSRSTLKGFIRPSRLI